MLLKKCLENLWGQGQVHRMSSQVILLLGLLVNYIPLWGLWCQSAHLCPSHILGLPVAPHSGWCGDIENALPLVVLVVPVLHTKYLYAGRVLLYMSVV